MKEKRYKTISEVSEILNIGTHIIRYWDSKLSISNQSLNKKQKFFNNHDIEKLRNLKKTMFQKKTNELDKKTTDNKKIDINYLKLIRSDLVKLLDI